VEAASGLKLLATALPLKQRPFFTLIYCLRRLPSSLAISLVGAGQAGRTIPFGVLRQYPIVYIGLEPDTQVWRQPDRAREFP
jgi:hypothetical protein